MAYLYNNPQDTDGLKIASPAGLDVALREMHRQLRVVSVVKDDFHGYIIIVEDKSDG